MLFLVLIFFIVSPITIFYTMGYRYDTKNGIIKTTGVISVNIEPRDARVYLNEIQISERMPLRLPNKTPGMYRLRLQKEGYKTWEKEIPVHSNQTTYVHDFSLLKDAREVHVGLDEPIAVFDSLPVSEVLIGITEKNTPTSSYRLSLLDPKTGAVKFLKSFLYRPELSLSPFHGSAFVLEPRNNEIALELFDTKNTQRSSSAVFARPADISYQWSKRGGEIYLRVDNIVERFEYSGSRKQIGTVSSSSKTWYVEYPETVWITDGQALRLQKEPQIAYSIPENTQSILDINKDRIILKTTSGFFVINRNKTFNAVNVISAHSWYYHPETEAWWVWSDWELWSIYKDGGVELLSREGKKISGALPLTQDGIKIILHEQGADAFNFPHFPTVPLIKRENIEFITTFPKENILYYTIIENGEKKLYKLEY